MIPAIENLASIESVLDMIDQPMFVLDVHGKNDFVFRHLNLCHRVITELDDGAMCGQRPHDVLPPRLADTLISNYETCRLSGVAYSYEENLELPAGTRWWQTTLSPVKDAGGRVIKIIGLAMDITARKERHFKASCKLAEMTTLNENLQVFAASTAQDLKGPFETMVALLDLVMDGFVDLGDEKMDQLLLCSEIASDAIVNMRGILDVAHGLNVDQGATELTDIHHITSDIAALLDPNQRLNIDLPRVQLETDRIALQMVMRNVMETAARYANRRVSVTVADRGNGFVEVSVSDDGVGPSPHKRSDGMAVLPDGSDNNCDFGLKSAIATVQSRGGGFVQAQCPFPTGTTLQFTLPGKFVGNGAASRPLDEQAVAGKVDGLTYVTGQTPHAIRPT